MLILKAERNWQLNENLKMELSGKRDSNPRPLAWEANALPTELLPLLYLKIKKEFLLLYIFKCIDFIYRKRMMQMLRIILIPFIFILWDRLFGTYTYVPVRQIPYGLDEFADKKKQTFWYLLKSPFLKIDRIPDNQVNEKGKVIGMKSSPQKATISKNKM